jgi:plasmid stability protein
MSVLTIRRLDDAVKARLRVRAARNGRSMEEEAREILTAAVADNSGPGANLFQEIRRVVEPLGGIEPGKD